MKTIRISEETLNEALRAIGRAVLHCNDKALDIRKAVEPWGDSESKKKMLEIAADYKSDAAKFQGAWNAIVGATK